jgi:hypothetical protein
LRRFTAAGLRGSPRRVPTGARCRREALRRLAAAAARECAEHIRIDKILFNPDHSQF